ncbi:MAG TPA: YihY/virulence factor BrkB family protein [Myxococcota bacterium]|nr:YihY/virulence factor BrkB family protein [Myxococcota bacterium]
MTRSPDRDDASRGREASSPTEIPARGWLDVARRVKREVSADNVGLVAAGVAFYALLAVFPGIAALVAVYALVADPQTIATQVESFPGLPAEAESIMTDQLHRVSSESSATLGLGFAFSLLLAIWSASKASSALMSAMNIVYDEEEGRGFFQFQLVALAFTLAAVLVGVLAIGAVAGVPAVLAFFPLGPVARWLAAAVPWLVIAGVLLVLLAALYRYGPYRTRAQWRWVTPGSGLTTLLWLVASAGFSVYVANFGNYNETYGSLGAVVVLLMWLWLSAYLVLVGAELNAEMEHQTKRDTTGDPEQPLGRRGAYVADTVGRSG